MTRELEHRLSSLSPERIQALVRKLGKPAGTGHARMPRNSEQRYPLSSAQERMWFLCQLSPGSRAFNNPIAVRLRPGEPLDRARLERSLNETVRQHEILRTTFHAERGVPVQVVHDEMPVAIAWEDLRGMPDERRESEAERLARAAGRQRFDLATGPLVALGVVRLRELEYLLLLTTHHIVSDGWSNVMLARELSATYASLERAGVPGLPPPELQYVDYVQWERDWMRDDKCRSQLAYWQRQLSPELPPLPLPAGRARPAVPSHAGGMETRLLPTGLGAALRDLAKEERVSLFQVLMAALAALLYRYTAQETITIGTSTANRNRRELQAVMGLFMNTLAIRAQVDGAGPFRALLRHVHTVCQDALAHQELPFEKLIGELNPQRALNAHPIFQVMFVHQNFPSLQEVSGIRMEVVKVEYGMAKLDLTLWAEEVDGDLLLTLYYARDLFEASAVRRMLAHYQALLASAVQHPDGRVDELACFPDAGIPAAAIRSVPPPANAPARALCFHHRFEAEAGRSPSRLAVEGGGETLTYGQLNAEANRLARHLLASGARPGTPVALLLSRTPRMIVGILGILKAGCAYLPLDMAHPPARLDLVLKDAGAGLLVTEERCRPVLASLSVALDAVDLDADAGAIARRHAQNLDDPTAAEGLAYVIYTSGTTGAPKGVAVEHRNLVSYCDAVWPVMQLSAGDRCATVSSLAADLGNTMIFPPLANGATVVVVPEDLIADAAGLAACFARHPVDALKIVPSHLGALLISGAAGHLFPRRLLMLGGEASPWELVDRVRAASPSCRIVNHYGPTETTIGVLTCEVPDGRDTAYGSLPLGFPLAGSQVYVLDKAGQPLPVGISGEVYIGGANVSRGYLHRPDRTAERFVPDPFGTGGRLYRTGDRAMLLESGAILFLGRVDRQVKIRGFRVELPEIERVLAQHSDVERAVVLPPSPGDPRQRLVACVQRRASSSIDAEALRQSLRSRLPAYMVPGAFAFPGSIPLTPNGKVDYHALSACEAQSPEMGREAPRDALELQLAHLWGALLGTDAIGISDNFFDVGGHSLLATQLMARISETFGARLPLATLFEHGTVRQMADLLRANKTVGSGSPLVAIQPRGSNPPLFFVHPAGGNVLCYYHLARSLGDGLPFYGLQALPSDGGQERTSVAAMARTYLDAILTVPGKGVPILGGWSMGALVAFEIAHLYTGARGQLPTVVVLDQRAPEAGSGDGQDDLSRLASFSRKVSELVGRDLGLDAAALAGRTEDERAALFLERFKAHGLAPEATDLKGFRSFLDLMLTHNRITADYAPEGYPGQVLVFRAADPMGFDGSANPPAERPWDLGWQKHTSNPVRVVDVPGNHVSMMQTPNVQTLAERLAERLGLS
jgi:amino acid adenylation domain-containing protein